MPEHSRSSLALLLESPRKYYLQYVEKSWNAEETLEMQLGNAVHTKVLEPELFKHLYILNTEGLSLATKEGKALKAKAEEDGKTLLNASDSETVLGIESSIVRNEYARMALYSRAKEREVMLQGNISWSGGVADCKGKLDVLGHGFIADLKTCDSAIRHKIARAMNENNLDLQAYMYTQLAGIDAFIFVFVEKKYPHLVRVYECSQEWIERGAAKFEKAMQLLEACTQSNHWPDFPEEDDDFFISIPKYLTV